MRSIFRMPSDDLAGGAKRRVPIPKGGIVLAFDRNQLSGNTAMLLLQLLSERDMYGYEMIEALGQRTGNVFELKAGTLYPLLHGLEGKNQLLSYEKEAEGKIRRYYRITGEGMKELKRKKKEWETYEKAVSQVIGGEAYGNG